jgi:AcrR family transcriptional regulator
MDKRELVRQHFAGVLMDLCESKQLHDVTVADVIAAAGTARQTFYNYFLDINDLICYAAFQPMLQAANPFTDPESTRHTYEVTLQHKAFFSQLPEHSGQNNFWDALERWLTQTYYDRYLTDDLDPAERAYRTACIDLYCIGSAAVFKKWCATGLETPVDVIVSMLYDMSPAFVKRDLVRMPERMSNYPR